MNVGWLLGWLGRIAFVAVLFGFLYELYRALAVSGPREAPPSRVGRLILEEVGASAEVWVKDGAGGHRRLTPGGGVVLRDRLEIGRDPENHVRVIDPYVSARHCEVRKQGGTFVVADLGATNGTRVDDRPVLGRAAIRPGSRIKVGGARFRFEVE